MPPPVDWLSRASAAIVSVQQLAIVVNEYGEVAGLVTIVDVVEEIVGDIPKRDPGPPPA